MNLNALLVWSDLPCPVSGTYLETRGEFSPAQVCYQPHVRLFQEPRKRCTYSQDYLSAMVEPQDSEEEEKKARKKSRQAWLTASGFQVTGLHSTDNDCHLRLPSTGSVRDVNEVPWEEQGPGGVCTRTSP